MRMPNVFEQLAIELTNAFRLDPRGEFDRLIRNDGAQEAEDPHVTAALRFYDVDMGVLRQELASASAAQPLAWNPRLQVSADGHSRAMIAADEQAHQLLGEPGTATRIANTGYQARYFGENVFAFGQNTQHAHAAFIIDWGPNPQGRQTQDGMQVDRGHRVNLLDGRFSEIGLSIVAERDDHTSVGPYVMTQHLALSRQAEPMLLGVIYVDRDHDDFYSIGEGIGGAQVMVAGGDAVRTADAGGYSLETEEEIATVTFSGRGVDRTIRVEVEIGRENVKMDLVGGRHLETSADLKLLFGAQSVTAMGAANIDLVGRAGQEHLIGNVGHNTLSGDGGRDRLSGNNGRDQIFGGDGRDQIYGGQGRDYLEGGNGSDRLFGGNTRDLIYGGQGHDRLWGGRGHDLLEGGDGRDRLFGGDGNDFLVGGDGRDRLIGRSGNDVLIGGGGADQFAFGANDGRNRILDWEPEDRLLLLARELERGDAVLSNSGDHALVEFGNTIILVKNEAGQIDQADFVF